MSTTACDLQLYERLTDRKSSQPGRRVVEIVKVLTTDNTREVGKTHLAGKSAATEIVITESLTMQAIWWESDILPIL